MDLNEKVADVDAVAQLELERLRPLRVAVESRDPTTVNELLERKPNLNCPEGGQILWTAIENDDIEIASMLVKAGADLSERKRGRNFLHALISTECSEKHQLALMMIERGADIHARDYHGCTALYYACQQQVMYLITELLSRKAVVEDFVITCAATKSNAAVILPMLIQTHGDDVEIRDRRAAFVIMYLTARDHDNRVAVIQSLLDIGVPVDYFNSCGWTPLIFATIFKRVGTVELLLKYGADVNKTSVSGVPAIFIASRLTDPTIAHMLVKKGANIHVPNGENGQYPLHAACENHSLSIINLLLSHGANINVVDRRSRTPFLLMNKDEKSDPCTRQIIKHFAILVSKGLRINKLDHTLIYKRKHTQTLYEDCLKELEKMKETKVYNDIPFFCVFSKNTQELSSLIRNSDFVDCYNTEPKESLFPIYFQDMDIAYKRAEERKNMLEKEENTLNSIVKGALPDLVLRRIAYYMCVQDSRAVYRSLRRNTRNK